MLSELEQACLFFALEDTQLAFLELFQQLGVLWGQIEGIVEEVLWALVHLFSPEVEDTE